MFFFGLQYACMALCVRDGCFYFMLVQTLALHAYVGHTRTRGWHVNLARGSAFADLALRRHPYTPVDPRFQDHVQTITRDDEFFQVYNTLQYANVQLHMINARCRQCRLIPKTATL